MGNARTALIIGLVAAASGATSPTLAGPAEEQVPNRLVTESFTSNGTTVGAYAFRGVGAARSVCAFATRVIQGSGRRVSSVQSGCSDRLDVTYRFDAVGWTAQVEGTIRQVRKREVHEYVDGEWQRVSSSRATTTAEIDLHWVGHGPVRPVVGASGLPLSCYALPPACMRAQASVERSATVSGSLVFHGLDASFDTPEEHAGTIGLHRVSV